MLKAIDKRIFVLFSCVFLLGVNIRLVEAVNEDQDDDGHGEKQSDENGPFFCATHKQVGF